MSLSPDLVKDILLYLGLEPAAPGFDLLHELIRSYTTTVPWESASRIAKRAVTTAIDDCPRWPEEFWGEALSRGTGGTCFESNYAFFALLKALGFDGYLTINDMDPDTSCHTAIVLRVAGERRLVDMGLPMYAALRFDGDGAQPARTLSSFHEYTVRPLGSDRYRVERTCHKKPVCFVLIDRPVDDDAYRRATTTDYAPGGYFLDKVVLSKVVNGLQWRFSSAERPWRLESFDRGQRREHALGADPAAEIADRFGIEPAIVRAALDARSSDRSVAAEG